MFPGGITGGFRPELILPQNMSDVNFKKLFIFTAAIVVIVVAGAWIAVPTVSITPASGKTDIPLGESLSINSSPLATIGKVAVYADEQPLAMEYNLETGDLARDFDLKPGQTVRVEAKIASIIGLTREFSTSFTTVEPVVVADISANGKQIAPGQKIPPQTALVFSFNKPLTQAAVSLDGGEAIDLQIDPDNPEEATLPPTVSFKQGTNLLMKIMATATDSATLESREFRAGIVKPLTLYGKVVENDGQTQIELDSSIAFANPQAVRAALETTLPNPEISVEKQKILINCSGLDAASEYAIKLARADGVDGSFLEAPLSMTVSFKANSTQAASAGTSSYRGYVYTSSSSSGSSSGGGGGSSGSGPPPGWPPCCPWPPA